MNNAIDVVETLKTLTELFPPDGELKWWQYLARAAQEGFLTQDERQACQDSIKNIGSLMSVAKNVK